MSELMDFTAHNEEVHRVWQAYREGKPIRVPMALSVEQRWWVLDPELNRSGITWHAYLNHPETMFQVCLKYKYDLAQRVPLPNLEAMYAAVKQFGIYPDN